MGEIIVLRLVHVIGGLFWVGSGLFAAVYLMPAMAEAGPAAGAVMAGIQRRRLFVVLPIVALLTILSGARLMWITSGGFAPGYFTSGRGATFTAAAIAALLAFLIGVVFTRPLAARMGALGAALRDTTDPEQKASISAEMSRLQQRGAIINRFNGVLLLLAAAGMAIGRYVP